LALFVEHILELRYKKTKVERFSRFWNDQQVMDKIDEINKCKKECEILMHTI
jgi:hypothetical protein